MSARGTTLAQAFSQKMLLEVYDRNLINTICNRDYEGEINQVGSVLNMLSLERITEKTYAGTAMVADSLYEKNCVLTIDKYKAFYWKEKTLDNWLSYIKNPKPKVIDQTAGERSRNIDLFALGLYGDVAAGNRVGTSYTTGTVTVDVTTGVVTPAGGATFSAAMEGKGFKALGHTKWYRVQVGSYASQGNGNLVIEDDEDDVASHYSGGAIAGGATFEIEAATVLTVTTSNLLDKIAALKLKLDIAEQNGNSTVPDTDRWLIVPPEFSAVLIKASGVALHVPEVYSDLVKKGMIAELQGFKVFQSNRLSGNN
ncbi:MAG: hypothetical protein HGB35_08985, partial [Geobacteraceae bacterium]|nr:hypothetical protein [Geobacteraceae bacterium]